MRAADTGTTYDITVQGRLKEKWAAWLSGMVVRISNTDDATVTVRVPDQAALRGVLNKLWDLNLILISVVRQDDASEHGAYHE